MARPRRTPQALPPAPRGAPAAMTGALFSRDPRRIIFMSTLLKAFRAVMNRFERFPEPQGEAELRYLDGEFRILRPGTFVRCAVTGQTIPLDELRYWSVDWQEAYADPEAVLTRVRERGRPMA